MIEATEYKSFEDAFSSIMAKDFEYIVLRHELSQDKKIKLHYHENANEWVVISNGSFKIILDDEEKEFNLENKVLAIKLPKKSKHTIIPISKLSYFVVRDCKDISIYID